MLCIEMLWIEHRGVKIAGNCGRERYRHLGVLSVRNAAKAQTFFQISRLFVMVLQLQIHWILLNHNQPDV